MSESLLALALLACPLGMGAMMWMMRKQHAPGPSEEVQVNQAELTALQAQVDQLRAQQRDEGQARTQKL